MKLTFVTSNENKFREVSSILGYEMERKEIDLTEIQDIETDNVVESKVKEAYNKIGGPVIVEDTGIFLEAWDGFPGALIKWVLKAKWDEGIYELVSTQDNKKAYAKTSVGYYDGNELKVFSGIVKGQICEPRGSTDFGWDTVFVPEGYNESFSEMGREGKNKISMRKKAFEKLREFLES